MFSQLVDNMSDSEIDKSCFHSTPIPSLLCECDLYKRSDSEVFAADRLPVVTDGHFFSLFPTNSANASRWNLFTAYCMIDYAISPLQCSGNIKLFRSPCQIHVLRRLPTRCWVLFSLSLPVGLNIIMGT